MKRICAELLFTNTGAPIEHGIVECDTGGKILRVLAPGEEGYSTDGARFIEGWVCAGFINAHCHLELSHLKGLICERIGLNGFIDALGELQSFEQERKQQAIVDADKLMQTEGIVAVIDICNTACSFEVKVESPIFYHSLIELFGIREERADALIKQGVDLYGELMTLPIANGNITPHAPYSLSPRLRQKIKEHCDATKQSIYSIHFMETISEAALFRDGSGNMAERLRAMGLITDAFLCIKSHPFRHIEPGFPAKGPLVFVHGTYLDCETLDMMRSYANRLWFALCPNANLFIEGQMPDLELIRKFTDKIVLGTDSLASNHNLSILEEMKTIQYRYPEISSEELVCWSSRNAAELIGKADVFGKIEAGMRPGLVQIGNVNKVSKKLTKSSFAKQICS